MSSNSNTRTNRRSNGNGSTPKKTNPKRLFWICTLLFILIVAGGGCGFISAHIIKSTGYIQCKPFCIVSDL